MYPDKEGTSSQCNACATKRPSKGVQYFGCFTPPHLHGQASEALGTAFKAKTFYLLHDSSGLRHRSGGPWLPLVLTILLVVILIVPCPSLGFYPSKCPPSRVPSTVVGRHSSLGRRLRERAMKGILPFVLSSLPIEAVQPRSRSKRFRFLQRTSGSLTHRKRSRDREWRNSHARSRTQVGCA